MQKNAESMLQECIEKAKLVLVIILQLLLLKELTDALIGNDSLVLGGQLCCVSGALSA